MLISQRSIIAAVVLSLLLLAGAATGDERADDAAQTYEKALGTYNRGDLPGALKLFREAAEAGSADAQAWLGYILDLAEENDEAARWYRAAADQGNKEGLAGLADMYAKGEGVAKDLGQARLLYEKAADAGHDRAAQVLAHAYEKGGLDVGPDGDQAAYWKARAAELAAAKTQE